MKQIFTLSLAAVKSFLYREKNVVFRNKAVFFLWLTASAFPFYAAWTRNFNSRPESDYTRFWQTFAIGFVLCRLTASFPKAAKTIRESFCACFMLTVIASFAGNFIGNAFLDRNGSIYPFLYSLAAAVVFMLPAAAVARRFLDKTGYYHLFSRFPLWMPALSLPWFWLHTENGWQPLLLIGGIIFYPHKFILCLYLLSLISAIAGNACPAKQTARTNNRATGRPLSTLLAFYLIFLFILPFSVPEKIVAPFAREKKISVHLLTWGCEEYQNDIKLLRQCLTEKTENYDKKYLYERDAANSVHRPVLPFADIKVAPAEKFVTLKEGTGDKWEGWSVTGEPYRISGIHETQTANKVGDKWGWIDFDNAPGQTFWAAYNPQAADAVILETDGEKEIFHAAEMLLNLNEKTVFADIILVRYRQTEREFTSRYYTRMQDVRFTRAGGWRFSRVEARPTTEKILKRRLYISADKRTDASVLFIKSGDKIFRIDMKDLK